MDKEGTQTRCHIERARQKHICRQGIGHTLHQGRGSVFVETCCTGTKFKRMDVPRCIGSRVNYPLEKGKSCHLHLLLVVVIPTLT